VRWEVTHALALVAASAPQVIAGLLPRLADIIRSDSSTIVRDYAVDVLSNYATTGSEAARRAYPLLEDALTLWGGKHAARALNGLRVVGLVAPEMADELHKLAQGCLDDRRGVVRQAAKSLMRATEVEG
jgi:hypothetical protein